MGCSRFFPMAVGRSWEYRLTLNGRDEGQVRQSILAVRHSPASSFWKVQRQITGAEPEQYPAVTSEVEVRVASSVILRAPLEQGAQWSDSNDEGVLCYAVNGTDLQAEVPAGRFVGCLEVIATRNGTEAQRTVYAPGIGMIRHRAPVPGGWLELALQSVDITDPERAE